MKGIFFVALFALVGYLIVPKTIFFYRKPLFRPKLGGLNNYDVVLKVNETYHLYILGLNKRISYQSTDIKVATINLNGSIRAWRPGTTFINVRYDDKLLRCRVRVIDLNEDKIKLCVGDSKRIYVKKAFFGVKYQTSNSKVVKVNRLGKVKAVGKGTATITVTYRGKKLKCKVVVSS